MDIYQQIKARLSCSELCYRLGVDVSSQGFASCSNERTPSLKIYLDGWKCYRCNERGDVIDLYAHITGENAKASLRSCCDMLGIRQDKEIYVKPAKYDLEALESAFSGDFANYYSRSSFSSDITYKIYCVLYYGIGFENTEVARIHAIRIGHGWSKRENPTVNQIVDYVLFGFNAKECCKMVKNINTQCIGVTANG